MNRPDPNKKWSPQEILDIPVPRDSRESARSNARSAATAAVAEAKILRDRIRRARILNFLENNNDVTIAQIVRHFSPEAIGIRTVWGYLKVFEQEGKAKLSGNIWNSTMARRSTPGISQSLIQNQMRRELISALLIEPMTAHEISLKLPGFISTGTVICRLRELLAEGKIEQCANNKWQHI